MLLIVIYIWLFPIPLPSHSRHQNHLGVLWVPQEAGPALLWSQSNPIQGLSLPDDPRWSAPPRTIRYGPQMIREGTRIFRDF